MNKILTISIVFFLSVTAGCGRKNIIKLPEKKGELLTVDFQKGKTLKYRFVSDRHTTVDWSSGQNGESVLNKSIEKLDLVMAYKPVKIEPFGLTTIKAECREAKVSSSNSSPKDAVEFFNGKTFTFTVDSSGKIHDYSELNDLIKQAGQKAFASGTGANRIKEPDMIGDFAATQWFLWDSIASIPNAAQGVNVGQSWTSKLSVPTPMVSRLARDVNYTLAEVQSSDNTNIAVIDSTYSKSDSVPASWPVPYTGSFQVRGTFGLLGGYKLLELKGQGKEIFNIDLGRIEEYNQKYKLVVQASVPMGISVKPVINIEQTISMKLVEE